MNQKKMLLIVNPRSGRKKYNDDMLEADYIFSRAGYNITVLNTGKHGDATDFARRFASEYDTVVCRGGDGTFCEMLTGMMDLNHRPPVGFIPAGTTNDYANTLGVPLKPRKAADLIVSSDALPCDIGCMDGKYFTYVASFGALTECSYAAPQSLKNKIGRAAYFYEAAKEVKDIHSTPLRVVVDGEEIEDEFIFGAVSNTYSVGKIIHLDRDFVCLNDGKFEVILAKNPGTVKGWADLAVSVFRRDFDKRFVTILQASEVKIKTLDGQPLPWTLDGEYGGDDNDVTITVHHNAFNMFRPRLAHEEIDEDEDAPEKEPATK